MISMELFNDFNGIVSEIWRFCCRKVAVLLRKIGGFIAGKMTVAAGSAGILDRCDCCAGGMKGQEGGYTMGRLMPLIFW
jgi:hypothetical protein